MAAQQQTAITILRRKQVEARTGLSRSTIYAKIRRNPKRFGATPSAPATTTPPFPGRYLSEQKPWGGLKLKSTPG